jgi:hypothetical protein
MLHSYFSMPLMHACSMFPLLTLLFCCCRFLLLVQTLFEQILAGLLSRVAEGNGRVQEAACSSLAELLEHAGACTHGAVLVPRMQVNAVGCCAQLHGAAA